MHESPDFNTHETDVVGEMFVSGKNPGLRQEGIEKGLPVVVSAVLNQREKVAVIGREVFAFAKIGDPVGVKQK